MNYEELSAEKLVNVLNDGTLCGSELFECFESLEELHRDHVKIKNIDFDGQMSAFSPYQKRTYAVYEITFKSGNKKNLMLDCEYDSWDGGQYEYANYYFCEPEKVEVTTWKPIS